jgi:inorganic pyrophosphatase
MKRVATRTPFRPLDRLPARPTPHIPGAFHVVVESPRGASVKWKFDPALNALSISRPLPLGLTYPYDWGFVPSTRAPDGDPLDALVLWEQPGFPGAVLPCRVIGALKVEQNKKGGGRERNDRLIAIPLASQRQAGLNDVAALATREREELEAFFREAVRLEDKALALLGWAGPKEGAALLTRALRAARRR